MRLLHAGWVFSLCAAATLGCGAGSGPSEEEMVGTWHATKIEFVSTTGLGSVDIMTLGAGITLELGAGGAGVLTFTRVGGHVDVMTGTWESSIDVFSFGLTPSSNWSWEMEKSGNQLTLTGADTSWDFDGDGTQDPATWTLVLVK